MSDAPVLQVEIVTPEKRVFSGEASEVLLPAWEGQMGIYPQHDSLLTLLRCGRCVVATKSGVKEYVVGRGFAEIGPTVVTLLTEACDVRDEIDRDAAQRDLDEAEKALGTMEDVYSEQYKQLQIAHEHAKARLGLR